jgi:hypothetical protein
MSGLVQGTQETHGFSENLLGMIGRWPYMITRPTQTLKEADPTNIFLGIGVECRYDPDRWKLD